MPVVVENSHAWTRAPHSGMRSSMQQRAAYIRRSAAAVAGRAASVLLWQLPPGSRNAARAALCDDRDSISRSEEVLKQLATPFPTTLSLPGAQLPALSSAKHYVNLTNGLEALPLLNQHGLQYSFCRLRSTRLEQQALEQFVAEVDAGLLMALALGHTVVVWDCGSRSPSHGAPRAIWYGLEFLRFVVHRSWWGDGGRAHLKGHNSSDHFEAACRSFHQSTSRRIKYYKRYVPASSQCVQLYGAFKGTTEDANLEHWVQLAHRCAGPDATRLEHAAELPSPRARAQDVQLALSMLQAGYALAGPGLCHEGFKTIKNADLPSA